MENFLKEQVTMTIGMYSLRVLYAIAFGIFITKFYF
jgi:hypothetical protein